MKWRLPLQIIFSAILFSCESEPDPTVEPAVSATVETYAGSVMGSEDGTTSTAQFNEPEWITVTPGGDAYVVDQKGAAIRRISSAGVVTTEFFSANQDIDAITSDKQGNVYFSTFGKIRKLTGTNLSVIVADGIPQNYFSFITSLAMHPDGSIYCFESGNTRIIRTTIAGDMSIIAGGPEGYKDGPIADAQFSGYSRIIISPTGDIYVCDWQNRNIRKISDGHVTSYSNNKSKFMENPSEPGSFNSPVDLLVDASGSIYISTLSDNTISKLGVGPIAGGTSGYKDGEGLKARFNFNSGIAFDPDGNILVCDSNNHLIRKVVLN